MSKRNAALVPRAGTRLVPRRARIATTRVPASPALPTHRRRAPVHAWLRELLTPPEPHSYLADSEQCLISTRLHWTAPLRTMLRMGVKMSLTGTVLFILSYLAPGLLIIQIVLALAALSHTAYLGYVILLWRTDTIMVTDRRIIRVSGLLTLTADTVNLSQVTDATLHQSLPGRVLDYGTLRIESAGQRQSLERLDYLPAPGVIYRATLAHPHTP